MKTLETNRLILRNWNMYDIDDFFEYAKSNNVGPMAGWQPHKSLDESKNILKMFIETDHCAIILKENNKAIGSIGIHNIENENAVEIGFALSESYWGQGLMPEAVKCYIEYLFNEFKFDLLYAGHFDFNLQSKRVIEKLGFEYFNTTIYERKYDGAIINKLNYKLLKP